VKIGVVSDSHGDIYAVKRAISKMGNVDMIIHLGDYFRDAESVSKELQREIIYVRGNCDFSHDVECDKIIQAEDKKLLITHGHNYNVKADYTKLYFKALESGVDAVLFGHTHYAQVFENNNIVFINPGSLSKPKGNAETYAIVTICNGSIVTNRIELY